ncbi:hypothetical protein L208DRAFT_1349316 [Tricholoma matsutake]|nr:hypothetical protein L208DRAFT_1349316 [Tricholoma matsutake 945]
MFETFVQEEWNFDSKPTGQNILVIVHDNGVHHLPVQWCQCPGHLPEDIQALDLQFFPASFKRVRTLFSFQGLDAFLAENQECKSSAWHYYQKLRRFMSGSFPHIVPDRYRELLRCTRQYQNIKHVKWHGFGHDVQPPGLGELSVWCPACPQPGVNISEDWEQDKDHINCRWVYTWSFAIDGNFTASHQRQKRPNDDVPLTNGQSFMTESSLYKKHLKVAMESKRQPCTCNEFKAERSQKIDVAACDATGIGSVVCLQNGFFIPEATVDFQKGEQ